MVSELDLRHLKIQCLWEAAGGVEAIKRNQAYLLCPGETQEVEAPDATKSGNAGQT